MITATVTMSHGSVREFTIGGHAMFADYGDDIVCSAVSILFINTVNSIEALLGEVLPVERDDEKETFRLQVPEGTSEGARLLLASMIFGLESIEKEYGDNYISINTQEV